MGFMRSLVHGIEFGIGASKMTNLEALRQELREFVDEATDRDLYNIASSLGYDICDRCATVSCDRDCFTGFSAWGEREHKETEDKNK